MINELEKASRPKQKLRAGQCCLGAQIALCDPVVAEIFGRAAHNIETVKWMLKAAAATPAVLLAKPLKLDAEAQAEESGGVSPSSTRGQERP